MPYAHGVLNKTERIFLFPPFPLSDICDEQKVGRYQVVVAETF